MVEIWLRGWLSSSIAATETVAYAAFTPRSTARFKCKVRVVQRQGQPVYNVIARDDANSYRSCSLYLFHLGLLWRSVSCVLYTFSHQPVCGILLCAVNVLFIITLLSHLAISCYVSVSGWEAFVLCHQPLQATSRDSWTFFLSNFSLCLRCFTAEQCIWSLVMLIFSIHANLQDCHVHVCLILC